MVVGPHNLLVDPWLGAALPAADALGEPKSDFLLGGLDRVTSVADVASDLDAEVSTNGAHGTLRRHGGTEHFASDENCESYKKLIWPSKKDAHAVRKLAVAINTTRTYSLLTLLELAAATAQRSIFDRNHGRWGDPVVSVSLIGTVRKRRG